MLISRLFKSFVTSAFLFCTIVGCGTSVDTAPATGEVNSEGESSTDDMTEEEKKEFEEGEGEEE